MFEKIVSNFSLCDMKVKIPEANYHVKSQYMLNISKKKLKMSNKPLLCLRTSKILSLGQFVRSTLGYHYLAQNIEKMMILKLTKHSYKLFLYLTP